MHAFRVGDPATFRPPEFTKNGRFVTFGRGAGRAYDVQRGDWLRTEKVTLSADGSRFVVCSANAFSVYDSLNGTPLASSDAEIGNRKFCSISPDGRWILVHDAAEGTPLILDAATCKPAPEASSKALVRPAIANELMQSIPDMPGPETKESLLDPERLSDDFSPDSTRIVTEMHGGLILVDVKLNTVIAALPGSRARFSPDSRWIVTENDSETVTFDARSARQIRCIAGYSAQFSPDGRFLATLVRCPSGPFAVADKRFTVRISDPESGKLLYEMTELPIDPRFVLSLASRNRIFLNKDHQAISWDAASGANWECSGVRAVLSPNGRRCIKWIPPGPGSISCGVDVSDGETGTWLSTLRGPGGYVTSAAISVNSDQVVTEDLDGLTCIWSCRRPEYWWGVAWLPEFWLTAVFAGALGWSVWRDRRMPNKRTEAAA